MGFFGSALFCCIDRFCMFIVLRLIYVVESTALGERVQILYVEHCNSEFSLAFMFYL